MPSNTTSIKLIIGLGNPGEEYDNTRHNIGFEVLDALVNKYGSEWIKDKSASALVSKIKLDNQSVVLAKPQTFMNRSGATAAYLKRKLNIKPEEVMVIHDDSDIELGNLKMVFGRGSAGHKGVENILQSLKTKNIWRLRIGIQKKNRSRAEKIVLQKWGKGDAKTLEKNFEKAVAAIEEAVKKNPELAMNVINRN